MSKVARVVGSVAGMVASVASVIPGGQAIAAIAGTVAGVSSLVASVTAKPPRVRGQLTNRTIGANQPLPYLMGEAYSAGVQVIDVGYGATLNKVPNPYRFIAVVHSCCGPVEQLVETQAEFAPLTFTGAAANGYFNGYLYRSSQLGQQPEAAALVPQWAGAPNWGAAHRLSGMAAEGWSFKFDKDGKVFASGLPALGSVWRGVRVYDPRLDSTYPGGAGPQRIGDEATWAYSRNPALHALAYAYGRYANGRKVFGVDLKGAGILLPPFVALANVCDLNNWTVNGQMFEPGDKWNNLKLICQAGAAEPMFEGGALSLVWSAPRVSLDTITLADLADGELSAPAMKPWRERVNTVVPRFRSPANQWGMVAGAAVADATALAEDGEVKSVEAPFELVTDGTQAAQLAGYRIADARERGPIVVRCKPRLADYGPGDCLSLAAELAAQLAVTTTKCVVRRCEIDPATGVVTLTLVTETDAKHDFALGRTTVLPPAVPPPAPATADAIAAAVFLDPAAEARAVADSKQRPFYQAAPPSAVGSAEGDSWQDSDDGFREYHRIAGDGRESFGGAVPLYGADGVVLAAPFALAGDARIQQGLDAATAAGALAAAAAARVEAIVSDGVLDRGEKQQYLIDTTAWQAEYGDTVARAAAVGVSSSAYIAAYDALFAYLGALRPVYTDKAVDTPIDSGTFAASNGALILQRGLLRSAIESKASATANLVKAAQPTVTIEADYTGTPNPDLLPRNVGFKYTRGTADLTASAAWARTVVSGNVTCTVTGGVLSITAVGSGTSVVRVTGTIDGEDRADTITILRNDAAPPASTGGSGGGGGASTATTATVSGCASTSYGAANIAPLTVTVGASGTVTVSVPLDFVRQSSASGTSLAYGKLQGRSGTSGSFVDIAAEQAADSAATTSNADGFTDQSSGSLSFTRSATGLTPGSTYQVQLLLRGGSAVALAFSTSNIVATSS